MEKRLVSAKCFERLEFGRITATRNMPHDLDTSLISYGVRNFIVNIHTLIIIFFQIKAQERIFIGLFHYDALIDQIIIKIVMKAAVFILRRIGANRCFHGILMNISDYCEQVCSVFYRLALKSGLEQAADALVFCIVPLDKTGTDVLKNYSEIHFTNLDEEVYVIGHQAVSKERKVTFVLISVKNLQKLVIVCIVFEDTLFIDAAQNNVVDTSVTYKPRF